MHHIDDNNCWRWLTMLMQNDVSARLSNRSQISNSNTWWYSSISFQYHSTLRKQISKNFTEFLDDVGGRYLLLSHDVVCCLLLLRDWRRSRCWLLSNGSCDPSRQKVKESLTEASIFIGIPMCLQPTMDEKRPNLNEFKFASKLGTEFQCRLHASLT